MKNLKTLFLLSILVLLNSCGESVSGRSYSSPPFNLNPNEVDYNVSVLKKDATKRFEQKNPIALLMRTNSGVASCTGSLLANGYILTNAHCILDDYNQPTPPQYLHIFFKNPSDDKPSYFKVKRIVDFKRVEIGFDGRNEFPLSEGERKYNFSSKAMDILKNSEDWALLEIEDSQKAINQFSALESIDSENFDYNKFVSDIVSNGNVLTYYAVNPNIQIRDDRLDGSLDLKIVTTTIDRRVPREYRKIYLDQAMSMSDATIKVLRTFKTLPLSDSLAIQGNSGSAILYDGKIIALLFGGYTFEVCTDLECHWATTVQWFLGMPTTFMNLLQ